MLYSPREVNKPMEIGSAMHAAWSILSTKGTTEDEAFEAIYDYLSWIKDPTVRDDCENGAVEILSGYLDYWQPKDRVYTFAEEKPFFLPLVPDLNPIGGRRDGLFMRDGKVWILERKTTSSYLEAFFNSVERLAQIYCYSWATIKEVGEQNFGGVLVDVVQKKTKIHGMDFGARYFAYDRKKVLKWERDTKSLIINIDRACKENVFYANSNICPMYYGKCEFYDYCGTDNLKILRNTHKEDIKEEVMIIEGDHISNYCTRNMRSYRIRNTIPARRRIRP